MSVFGYIQIKKYNAKSAVEHYLITEKNIKKSDIEELDPFTSHIAGDKNWLVFVKLKNDTTYYYYYKNTDTNKVVLESESPKEERNE